jgi:hypothetical protein
MCLESRTDFLELRGPFFIRDALGSQFDATVGKVLSFAFVGSAICRLLRLASQGID